MPTSSSRRMRGLRSSARAMAMRCFWPPDIWIPFSPMCVSYLQQLQIWYGRPTVLCLWGPTRSFVT